MCIRQDFIVPKAHHDIALFFKPGISLFVFEDLVRQGVLTAIQLNNESSFKAHKVNNIPANGMLAPKLHAFESACP